MSANNFITPKPHHNHKWTESAVRTDAPFSGHISAPEQALADWLKSLGLEVTQQKQVASFKYDICIESAKLLIEYNGVYWHSRAANPDGQPSYHRNRHRLTRRVGEDAGYRVMHIWSDEWDNHRERLERLVKDACGLGDRVTVGGRKLHMEEVGPNTAFNHHMANHLQQSRPNGGVHVGFYSGDELLVVCSFKGLKLGAAKADWWNLSRMSVKTGFSCPGVLQRAIKHLLSKHANLPIKTDCDRDYFTGSIYHAAGFKSVSTTNQLTYLVGQTRVRREHYMRWKLPEKFGFPAYGTEGCPYLESNIEEKICEDHKVYACYNSGIETFHLLPG